jgi:hypothetical protein
MRLRIVTFCVALLLCSFCCHSARAQEDHDQDGRWINGITEPWTFDGDSYTKEEAAAFQQKWKSIAAQRSPGVANEWAGDYVRGDLHKTYLRWSPEGGFAYVYVFTCSTGVLGINYGRVDASPMAIRLYPVLSMSTSRPHGHHGGHAAYKLPKNYLPVKWGEQHYLVAENRVAAFYRFAAGLGEYQTHSGEDFFIKTDDYAKEPESMPVFPPGYERFVRKPIEAKIISVGPKRLRRVPTTDGSYFYDSVTAVRISAGKADGVYKGMAIYVVGSKFSEKVEIAKVGKRSAWGIISRLVDDNKIEKDWNHDMRQWEDYPEISVGWDLTTSIYLSKQL